MKSIGYLYLIETFKLNVCELQSRAHLTNQSVREVHRQNDGIDVYYPVGRIKVEDSWQGNLLFALKHEGVNLDFQRVIVETIRSEWRTELDYLVDYDRIREGMRQIVDLPEKKANQFILFVKNNRGRLSAAKRRFFAELTDEEVRSLEQIVCPCDLVGRDGIA